MPKQANTSIAIITAAMLTACGSNITTPGSDATDYALTDEQPALETVLADNEPVALNNTNHPAYLLVRTIYDSNRDAKIQITEPPIPGWGLRITPLNANNQASGPARIERTPTGSRRYIGTFLNLPYGSYKIEELIPVSTAGANDGWIGTRGNERTVTLDKNVPFRNVDFTNACLENNQVIAFPKTNFSEWRCAPKFDLAPRISSFVANPASITVGQESKLEWSGLCRTLQP